MPITDLLNNPDPTPSPQQRPEAPVYEEPQEFSGSGPGFDAADLYSVPMGLLGSAFKWTTGLVQRPILTGAAYLGQQTQTPFERKRELAEGNRVINPSDILGSSFTPELEANPVDYWAPELARAERERLRRVKDPGILDRLLSPYGALTLGTQIVTDPSTYTGFGALSKGKIGASAAARYNNVAMKMAQLNKSEMVTRPMLQALAKKLGVEEVVAGAKATGVQPTLAGRLAAGETGLRFGIGKATAELTPINKLILAPLARVTATPLGQMLEGLAGTRWGEKISQTANLFREKPVDELAGMTEESAKRVATAEAYELANRLNIPAMEESLLKLSKAIKSTPEETTRLVTQWEESHLKWDFGEMAAVSRTLPTGSKVRAILAETDPAKRLKLLHQAAKGTELSPLQYKSFIESEEFVRTKLTSDKKMAVFNELNAQVELGRQAMQKADTRLGLGGKQMGAEFHAELQRLDKAIESVAAQRNKLLAQLDDVTKRSESLGGAGRAAGATAGGTATVSAGSSLSPAEFAGSQLDSMRISLKAQLAAVDEKLFNKTTGLTAQRAAMQQKLLDTPIWVPRAKGEDVVVEQGFKGQGGQGGGKPSLKQGRTTWDEYFRNAQLGYQVRNGEVVFGQMPKTKPELLTHYAKNQERIAALEKTVEEAKRIREAPFQKTQAVSALLREYEHSPGAIRRMTDAQAREALLAGQARRMNANMQGAGATGAKAFESDMFQGRGATAESIYGKENVAAGRGVPILGSGKYYAFSEGDASVYGKVSTHKVRLENPLVIGSDREFFDLLKRAGTEELSSVHPSYYTKDVGKAAEKLKGYVLAEGHDGIVIKNVQGNKRLGESLGHDQVVSYSKPAAVPPSVASKIPKVEARIQKLEETVRREIEAQKAAMSAPLAETERIIAKAEEELASARSTGERLNKEILEDNAALEAGGKWHSLEGIPMFRDYIEDAIMKHGSASTSWEVPLTGKKWNEIVATATKSMTDDTAKAMESGAKMNSKAAAAEAKEAAQFFSQNLTHAFAGKLKRFYNDVNQAMVERMIVSQTKAIRKADWDGALRASQTKGATWESIEKTFKKNTGMEISEFLPENYRSMKPADAIGPGPRGYQPTSGAGNRFAEFKTFDGYVPTDWMREYSRWRIGNTQALIATAVNAMGPLVAMTTAFKRAALAFPDYHTRNAITDLVRMGQEGLLSTYTASDIAILMKEVFPEITRNGWGDFSKFAGIQVPGMNKTLDVLLKEATENGVLHTGPMWQVVYDAAEDVTDQLGRGKVEGMLFKGGVGEVKRDIKAGKLPNRLTTFGVNPRALAAREEFFRLSAFFEAQRKGMPVWEAGSAAQKALFDYSNLSPFGDFARRTGLSPFISFSMKNIAAQTRLLIEKPWQFAAMIHIQKAIQSGNAPSGEGLSRWARDKYNINLRVGKDENGRPQYEYITASGVIPQADLVDIMQNPMSYASGQLGPLFKMGYEMMKEQELPEDERQGLIGTGLGLAGESVPVIGGKPGIAVEAWGGKPLRFAQQVLAGMPTYAEQEYLRKHGKIKQDSRLERLKDYTFPSRERHADVVDTEDKAASRIVMQMAKAKGYLKKKVQLYRQYQAAVEQGMIQTNPMEADIQKYRADYARLEERLKAALLESKRKKRRAMQEAAAP